MPKEYLTDSKGSTPVAHLIRNYLGPTETFIGYQIFSLRSFKPLVFCHQSNRDNSFVLKDTFCTTEILKGFSKINANLFYSLFRCLTKKETELFLEIIKSSQVKLLHFHYAVDARYFLSLKKKLNLPSVVSLYGYDTSSFPRSYFSYGRVYIKPIFEQIDKFLAMSEDMKKDLIGLGCPEEKILVHYYGIETEKFAYPERKYEDKEIVNILMCGTLEIKKAQHLVLEALRQLEISKNLKKKFQVTVVGDGPMRKHLINMVKDFEWENRVSFKGFIPYNDDRLVEEYQKADIFALPSITVKGDKEGIPGTIVEAMASGLPVVSTFHAGIPEIIENYKQGILVKERDIDGLAEALRGLIGNRVLRENLGRTAAERAIKEFDAKMRIKNLEKIYQSLL